MNYLLMKTQFQTIMKNRFNIVLCSFLALLFGLEIFNTFHHHRDGLTAYVNTEQVYNNFDLKKKMESELKRTEQIRTNILDSMKLQLDLMYSHMQSKNELNDSFMTT